MPAKAGLVLSDELRVQSAKWQILHTAFSIQMVPEVGIAPTSPRLQRGANLPQLLGDWLAEPKLGERRLVVPRGNAPRSSGYQPGALLLSYETMVNCGLAPNRFTGRNTRFNRCDGRIRMARFGL